MLQHGHTAYTVCAHGFMMRSRTAILGGAMRRTAVLFTAVCLALAGCSSGGEQPSPAATKTVTASPSLSEAEARQACVDAWAGWFEEAPDDYDPDVDPLPTLPACDGRSDSAQLGFEAIKKRNEENRARMDECLEDPACTELPLG